MKLFQKLRKKIVVGVFIISTIIFYYAGLHLGLQNFGFSVLFPALFALTLVIDLRTIRINNQEISLYLLFLILTLVSVFYENIVMDQLLFSTPKILASFMAAYIAIGINKTKNYEDYFHVGYIMVLLMVIFFEYQLGNFSLTNFYRPQGSRGVFSYNANYYSYISLFANFSILRLYLKYRHPIIKIGCFVLPMIALAMSFTTQSRSGLLFVLLINAVFWFWVKKDKNAQPLQKIFRRLVLLSAAIFFVFQFTNFYNKSSIQNRATEDGGREYLFQQGLNIFMEYPFTGVGTGNFIYYNKAGLFTHSSYSEALAEHGLFIGGIMILVFIIPLIKSYKLYWKFKANQEVKLNFLFFSTFFIYNNVYVFYKASFAMMYFFLMISVHYSIDSKTKSFDEK